MSASPIRASDIQSQVRPTGARSASSGKGFSDIYDSAAGGAGGKQPGTSQAAGSADPGSGGGAGGGNVAGPGQAAAPDATGRDASSASGPKVGETAGDGTGKGAGAEAGQSSSDAATATDAALANAAENEAAPDAGAASGAQGAGLPETGKPTGKTDDAAPRDGSDAHAPDAGGKDKKDADASGVIAAILAPVVTLPDLAKALSKAAASDAAAASGKTAAAGGAAAAAEDRPADGKPQAAAGQAGPRPVAATLASGSPQSALLSLNARLAAIKTAGEGTDGVAAQAAPVNDEQTSKAAADATRVAGIASGDTGTETAGDKSGSKSDLGAFLAGMSGGNPGLASPERTVATLAVRIASGAAAAGASQAAAAAMSPAAVPRTVSSLKIELNPASLGSVTATLRVVGNKLAIDLKVETDAAYHELSTGNDALVDKLKGHGYVVEQVTVQHVGGADRPAQAQLQQNPGSGQQQASGQAGSGARQQSFGRGAGGQGGRADAGAPAMVAQPASASHGDGRRGADGIYL